MSIKISTANNGPYIVEGDLAGLQLTDADGQNFDTGGKPKLFLCRCGASVNKPFCDGQHSKMGFQAAEAAVRNS